MKTSSCYVCGKSVSATTSSHWVTIQINCNYQFFGVGDYYIKFHPECFETIADRSMTDSINKIIDKDKVINNELIQKAFKNLRNMYSENIPGSSFYQTPNGKVCFNCQSPTCYGNCIEAESP